MTILVPTYTPFNTVFNNNGIISPGGTVGVYLADTLTLTDIFLDAAGTVPAENPYYADDYGRLPTLFIGRGITYKMVFKDADGNILGTYNNLRNEVNPASIITTYGDLIVGNIDGEATRFPVGANGTILYSNGSTLEYFNYVASNVDIITGIDNTKAITPLGLRNNRSTTADIQTGTDNVKYVTPLGAAWAVNNLSAVQLIQTITASNIASVSFTGLSSTYSSYKIILSNIVPAAASTILRCRISQDNGSTWGSGAGNYQWVINTITSANENYIQSSESDSSIALTGTGGGFNPSNNIALGISGEILLTYHAGSTNIKRIGIVGGGFRNTGANHYSDIKGSGAYVVNTNPINGLQFFFSTGNIGSGIFKLYGLL